jgi:hypothetical protein
VTPGSSRGSALIHDPGGRLQDIADQDLWRAVARLRGARGAAVTNGRRSLSHSYRRGCRCLTCRRDESLRVRAAYERSCTTCGGPCWGWRCSECVRRERIKRSVQPRGLTYQWGCP